MSDRAKIYAVFHDTHYPLVHKPTFKAALHFLKENKVDGITFGGDQFHMDEISHHTKGKGLYRLPKSYMNNLNGFDEEILGPIEDVTKGASKVYHIGNHERFETDFLEEHPELVGTVDHVRILNLVERGWKVVPLGHCSKLGKLNVIHGEILSGIGNQSSQYPAKKAVELYGASVLAGHTHSPQSYARVSPVENIQKHMSWIAPCMCTINPTYLRNRPVSWVNGFTVVEVMPNRNFNVYPCIISQGRFSFGGKIYGQKG